MELPKADIFYTKIPEMDQPQERLTEQPGPNKKQKESMTGQRLLAYGLRHLYHLSLSDTIKGQGKQKKPYFKSHPQIHYNISHSGEYAVCAFSTSEIGVDIQRHRQLDYEKMAMRTLSQNEYTCWKAAASAEKEFYHYWVLKESYLKWTGEGITRDLRHLKMDGWHQILSIAEGYSAAIWSGLEHNISTHCIKAEDL